MSADEIVLRPIGVVRTAHRSVEATPIQARLNPIGLSLIRIERIEGAELTFTGVDLVDGTPVLDLKPWVPQFDLPTPGLVDHAADVRIGWYRSSALGRSED